MKYKRFIPTKLAIRVAVVVTVIGFGTLTVPSPSHAQVPTQCRSELAQYGYLPGFRTIRRGSTYVDTCVYGQRMWWGGYKYVRLTVWQRNSMKYYTERITYRWY